MRFALLLRIAAAAILGAGCQAPPVLDPDPLAAAPEDLLIDVTVLRDGAAGDAPEVQRRPLRLVLFADGSLHGAAADARGVRSMPEKVRTLSRRQTAEAWSLARRLGLADPEAGEAPGNLARVEPPPGGLVHVIDLTAGGERRVFLRSAPAGAEPDPATTRFVRHLAALAWVSDLPPEPVLVAPRRYDLGPDPYARYRAR